MRLDFYGCSFTAGDELCDDVFFPWKHECANPQEYYIKRSEYFNNIPFLHEYKRQNALLAYPAQIEKLTGYQVFNHADNGASLRELIYKIIHQVSSNEQTDYIFLQIPPAAREYIINDVYPMSILMSTVIYSDHASRLKNYVKEKIVTHETYSWVVDDYMDLLMLDGFLTKKKIPYKILDVGNLNESKKELVGLQRYEFLNAEIDKLDILKLAEIHDIQRCFGGHFNLATHKKFAQAIIEILSNTTSK